MFTSKSSAFSTKLVLQDDLQILEMLKYRPKHLKAIFWFCIMPNVLWVHRYG